MAALIFCIVLTYCWPAHYNRLQPKNSNYPLRPHYCSAPVIHLCYKAMIGDFIQIIGTFLLIMQILCIEWMKSLLFRIKMLHLAEQWSWNIWWNMPISKCFFTENYWNEHVPVWLSCMPKICERFLHHIIKLLQLITIFMKILPGWAVTTVGGAYIYS